jgi:hypothetical protein
MLDRSYLTPLGQTAVGALVLIACVAWPPLIYILILIAFGRFLARARKGSTRSVITAAGAVIALSAGCVYVLPALAFVVLVLATAALIWLATSRVGAKKTTARDMLA